MQQRATGYRPDTGRKDKDGQGKNRFASGGAIHYRSGIMNMATNNHVMTHSGAPGVASLPPLPPVDVAAIGAGDVATYRRDGAICLRGIFSEAWLDRLTDGVEKNLASPGPYAHRYTTPGKPGGFHDDYCNWQRIAEYEDFALNSGAAGLVGKMTGSATVKFYHEHVLVKEPGTGDITPWHHDLPYYGLSGDMVCSIWLPLDDVPQSVCPEFVAGSHAWGTLYYPRFFLDHGDYAAGLDGYDSVPDIDGARSRYRILSWELQRGDCILFHMRTLHGAPGTGHLTQRRRGFSTRWLGDDARFATRVWETSPPFPDVNLAAGDALDHPLFPTVWRA